MTRLIKIMEGFGSFSYNNRDWSMVLKSLKGALFACVLVGHCRLRAGASLCYTYLFLVLVLLGGALVGVVVLVVVVVVMVDTVMDDAVVTVAVEEAELEEAEEAVAVPA